jgi:hypothetical protein
MGLNDDAKVMASTDMLVLKVINHFCVKILPIMSFVGGYMHFLVVFFLFLSLNVLPKAYMSNSFVVYFAFCCVVPNNQ